MIRGWQLVVQDPSWLSGPAVVEAIRSVAGSIGARYVVVDEVEGRGEVRLRLVSPDLLTFSVQGVVELLKKMLQLEWGDFFLVRTEDEANDLRLGDSYPSRVSKSLTTIRCVDNTFLYIYGTDASIRETVRKCLLVTESKEGLLSELDYPR